MTTLSSDTIKDLYLAKILYDLHVTNEKLSFFAAKYYCSFDVFESQMKNCSEENFEVWDDYLEWKAYNNILAELNTQKQDLENGNIKVA